MQPKKPDSGPAFPSKVIKKHEATFHDRRKIPVYEDMPGMSLRDYIAIKAMQGLIIQTTENFTPLTSYIIKLSFEFADEMLKERDKCQ